MAVGGIATIAGKRFAFPTDNGFGLVEIEGRTCLVRFSCPMESLSPMGTGEVVTYHYAGLGLEDGRLVTTRGETVVLGRELDPG